MMTRLGRACARRLGRLNFQTNPSPRCLFLIRQIRPNPTYYRGKAGQQYHQQVAMREYDRSNRAKANSRICLLSNRAKGTSQKKLKHLSCFTYFFKKKRIRRFCCQDACMMHLTRTRQIPLQSSIASQIQAFAAAFVFGPYFHRFQLKAKVSDRPKNTDTNHTVSDPCTSYTVIQCTRILHLILVRAIRYTVCQKRHRYADTEHTASDPCTSYAVYYYRPQLQQGITFAKQQNIVSSVFHAAMQCKALLNRQMVMLEMPSRNGTH